MSEAISAPTPVNDQSVELREKLGLTPYGVPQPELAAVPLPEKPTDLPDALKARLDKPTVIEK